MSLNPWMAFVEACDSGTVSGAAAVLGYTQSAVSRQVASLEREIGRPLLSRESRGVRPTPAGLALLPHARTVVAEADRGRRAAATAHPGRHVAVGCVPSAAVSFAPLALAGSSASATWALTTGLSHALVDQVSTGQLDLAIVTDAPPGLPALHDLVAIRLAGDRMAVLVGATHRLAGRKRVTVADLAAERWLEDNRGSETLLRQLAAGHADDLEIDRTPGDLAVKTALVAAGHGVALVPRMLAPALRSDVRLIDLLNAPRRGIYAVTRRGRNDLTAVLDDLRDSARVLP